MNKKFKKGFTIIELLVVIAIIAVLAAIVLVNVVQYIDKARRAATIANIDVLATSAAVAADGGRPVETMCADAAVARALAAADAANQAGNAVCNDDTTGWAACAQLLAPNTEYRCVDSGGVEKNVNATCSAADFTVFACP